MTDVLLIDGATGTELDRAGVDISLPLWSARALVDAPTTLRSIHEAYLEAGAQAVTTNTFRTSRRALARGGWEDRAVELTQIAVDLAREACERINPEAAILGSVAPIEECYDPDRAPSLDACVAEHTEFVEMLLNAGVDLVLIETMGTVREAHAAADAARRLTGGQWIISFCMQADATPGTLLSGESVLDVPHLDEAFAVGVNCVSALETEDHVHFLRANIPENVRIAAYANVGHPDKDGNWVITDAIDPLRYADYAQTWVDAGATIIGGCCGTTPATIAAIAKSLTEA